MTGHEHAPKWKHDGVRVIPGNSLDGNTPQTQGMDRKAAINYARVGAQKIWAGTVSIKPNAKTGAHHHGELDSCIILRTALIKDGTMYVQAGAGIVADSNPKSEQQECVDKAKALFRAAEEAKRFASAARRGQ